MGPALGKRYLQEAAFKQRAELDALLALLQLDGLALRYASDLRIAWPGIESELALVGKAGQEADVLVLVRQLGLNCAVTLRTTLEYEPLS